MNEWMNKWVNEWTKYNTMRLNQGAYHNHRRTVFQKHTFCAPPDISGQGWAMCNLRKLLRSSSCTTLEESLSLGKPGWLSRLSVRLLILAQVMESGSQDWALSWAPHSMGSMLEILSLSLCLSPHSCSLTPFLKETNKSLKKKVLSLDKVLD